VIITQAGPRGARLGADKGINLPDSVLGLADLNEKDRADLEFIATHADIVELSFVQDPKTIQEVVDCISAHSDRSLGLVLKIETRLGFERLPTLLLAAMRNYPVGVMIARGDLAVECGFERMAEVQEEILWLCEAAHVPAIWATQVLETMAKKGTPSRAEITDAASAVRAECVMLNKGPYILPTVAALDNVLRRMEEHQHKKSARLRELRVSAG
jgi:pyruvate kinase